jgi:PIN domain nuclease of toxin-antitoxin system
MNYLADTVAIVRHLGKRRKLGKDADKILTEADDGLHHIYISTITLMEVLYLAEANRIAISLFQLISHISSGKNYSIVPVDEAVVLTAVAITDVPELHDRIIVASAKYLDVPILTADAIISKSAHIQTVW